MSEIRHYRFDNAAFALVVHTKRFMAKQDLRSFGADTGIGYSALYRIEAKKTVSVEKFLKLCFALGEDPLTFLLDEHGKRVSRKTSAATGLQERNTEAAA